MNDKKLIALIRETRPLIHHITNSVTVNDCANITLAMGGRPIMAPCAEEAAEITASASALVLNIGTLMPDTLSAMLISGNAARKANIPVIFDPVGCGASAYRNSAARAILKQARPWVIKGNASEIASLLSMEKMSGVDSLRSGKAVADMAIKLAMTVKSVVIATGAADCITDGERVAYVHNGSEMLGRITGSGCMLGSLAACFASVCDDMFTAGLLATSVMGICGQLTASRLLRDEGTGTFRQKLIDAVSLISDDDIEKEANIEYEA